MEQQHPHPGNLQEALDYWSERSKRRAPKKEEVERVIRINEAIRERFAALPFLWESHTCSSLEIAVRHEPGNGNREACERLLREVPLEGVRVTVHEYTPAVSLVGRPSLLWGWLGL